MKKYSVPIVMLSIFETIAILLWKAKDNLFYLFNFSYIGISISLGLFLFINKYKYARRVVQLLVGSYMLIYLGVISRENMQIEGCSSPQQYIMSWQRSSGRLFLVEVGVVMHVGQQWFWTSFHTKYPKSQGKR